MERQGLFRSFVLGGFECSTHRRKTGERLDLTASTRHDVFVKQDYRRLHEIGIRTARDGVRWHLIETRPGRYDFSSAVPMIHAARETGTQVIWDLFHYGWPDGLDIFSPLFVDRFAAFARAFARMHAAETNADLYVCPVNEISFFSWAAGDMGIFNPFERGRGNELKRQLVRASIAAIEAVRDEAPRARFAIIDPLIHIATTPEMPAAMRQRADRHNRAQFSAWDMLSGREHPELGGAGKYLDIIGCNYYVHNQWIEGGRFIERWHPYYRPAWTMLREVFLRYQRPVFLAETGIEDQRRAEWLSYIADEVAAAIEHGVPMKGMCLYPIVNHPGWDDDRHCLNGLWDYADDAGGRECYAPLRREIRRQNARFSDYWEAIVIGDTEEAVAV